MTCYFSFIFHFRKAVKVQTFNLCFLDGHVVYKIECFICFLLYERLLLMLAVGLL